MSQIDPEQLITDHSLSDDLESMSKGELALLISAERFLMSLDHKSRWELEAEEAQFKYDKLFKKSVEMKQELKFVENKMKKTELYLDYLESDNASCR